MLNFAHPCRFFSRAGDPHLKLPPGWGAPGLDIETWESAKLGITENNNPQVEVHRLPHLKVEMWATQHLRRARTGCSSTAFCGRDTRWRLATACSVAPLSVHRPDRDHSGRQLHRDEFYPGSHWWSRRAGEYRGDPHTYAPTYSHTPPGLPPASRGAGSRRVPRPCRQSCRRRLRVRRQRIEFGIEPIGFWRKSFLYYYRVRPVGEYPDQPSSLYRVSARR